MFHDADGNEIGIGGEVASPTSGTAAGSLRSVSGNARIQP